MTETEIARRSDSLYFDGSFTINRRTLCDMVAHRESEIEDLKDEIYGLQCTIGQLERSRKQVDEANEELRDDYYKAMEANKRWMAKVASFESKNAKLRKLIKNMLNYIEIRKAFNIPPTSEICEEFSRRADELGIEVDNDDLQ